MRHCEKYVKRNPLATESLSGVGADQSSRRVLLDDRVRGVHKSAIWKPLPTLASPDRGRWDYHHYRVAKLIGFAIPTAHKTREVFTIKVASGCQRLTTSTARTGWRFHTSCDCTIATLLLFEHWDG